MQVCKHSKRSRGNTNTHSSGPRDDTDDARLLTFAGELSLCLRLEQKLQSVSKTDEGMYRCESSNSVGAPKSCVAQQLNVIECK